MKKYHITPVILMYDQVLIKPDSCVTMDDPNAHFPLPQRNFNNGRPDVAVFKLLIKKVLLWSLYLQINSTSPLLFRQRSLITACSTTISTKHKPLCVHTRWPEDDLSSQPSGADTLFPETRSLTSPGLH